MNLVDEMSEDGPIEPKGRGRERVWTVYLFFVLTLVVMLVTTALAAILSYFYEFGIDAPLVGARLASYAIEPRTLILSMWVTAATLVASTLLAFRVTDESISGALGSSLKTARLPSLLVAMIGAPALGAVLETVAQGLSVKESGTLKIIADAIAQAEGLEVPLFILGITVGPALGEELMFRGYIQTRLIRRHGPRLGIAIASALFGLLHMDALQSPLAGLLGVYIGFVAYQFGSLWPAVLAHGFNNFLSVSLLFLYPESAEDGKVSFISGLLGLAVFVFCLRYVARVGEHRRAVLASNEN